MTTAAEISRLASSHDTLVDVLDESHGARLSQILDELEEKIVRIVNAMPVKDGKLADAALAIKQRPAIVEAIRSTFLDWSHSSVNEYDDVAESVLKLMSNSLDGFIEGDAAVINQLKRIAFSGFEDIAETFADTLANGLYQSTISGRDAATAVKEMQQAINGVYIKSDVAEVQSLVDFVKANEGVASQQSAVSKAVGKLHQIYGSDRAGNNMRRYANQQVHDGLMQFSSSFTAKKAQDAGLTNYLYSGSLIKDSRDWCIRWAGETLSIDDLRELWANSEWQGKAPGDPLVVRGGFNCRHHWVPVEPEWTKQQAA